MCLPPFSHRFLRFCKQRLPISLAFTHFCPPFFLAFHPFLPLSYLFSKNLTRTPGKLIAIIQRGKTITLKEKPNSIQKTARTAGFLYMLLIPLGVFGMLYVPNTLFVSGDVTATVSNIMANQTLYSLSIVAALLTQVVQIFVVLYLYKVLKPVNKNHAVLMVVFILVAVPIAMLNENNQFAVLLLLNGAEFFGVDFLTFFTADQMEALVALFLGLRQTGIFIAQIFWGLWLFPMGYLVFKSGFLPKIIGALLIVAGFGYLIESLILFFVPDFSITITLFTFLGEFLITFWLLIKGVNVEVWNKRALESA
jgi:hypothetical protein